MSNQASPPLEQISAASRGLPWFHLYIQHDWDFSAARADAAGYGALVVTVDAPVSLRTREQRAGFVLPPGVDAVNLRGLPLSRDLPSSDPAPVNPAASNPSGALANRGRPGPHRPDLPFPART